MGDHKITRQKIKTRLIRIRTTTKVTKNQRYCALYHVAILLGSKSISQVVKKSTHHTRQIKLQSGQKNLAHFLYAL